MKTTIEVRQLREILIQNREKHQAIFEEAFTRFKQIVVETLEHNLKLAHEGREFRLAIGLARPVNQVKTYDQAIRALDLEVSKTITLDEREFGQFVMDEWGWKRDFLSSTAAYSKTAADELAGD